MPQVVLKKTIFSFVFGSLVVAAAPSKADVETNPQAQPIARFKMVNFTWGDIDAPRNGYQTYMDTKAWRNNSIAGVRQHKQDIFVTVPRWWPGVPSTLNKLVFQDGLPLLSPWPNWHLQTKDDCNCLQYVQSMDIDNDGLMWVIDAGSNVVHEGPGPCPPKIVLINVATGAVIESYTFPSSVVGRNGASFLNDIVIDTVEQVAYISDVGGGAIVVFDRGTQQRPGPRSRKFEDISTKAEPLVEPVVIGKINYGLDGPIPGAGVDGIALSPDRKWVFYAPLQGLSLYSVSARALRDVGSSEDEIRRTVRRRLGERPGLTDGLAFDSAGRLYMGGNSNSTLFGSQGDALFSWEPEDASHSTPKLEASHVPWVDTVDFDNAAGDLIFTTNKVDVFFNFRDTYWDEGFNTDENPNFGIWKKHVGAKSYIAAEHKIAPAVLSFLV